MMEERLIEQSVKIFRDSFRKDKKLKYREDGNFGCDYCVLGVVRQIYMEIRQKYEEEGFELETYGCLDLGRIIVRLFPEFCKFTEDIRGWNCKGRNNAFFKYFNSQRRFCKV